MSRAQANLLALAVAFTVVTVAVGVGLGVAGGSLAAADRETGERATAVSVSERLVAADGPLAVRANVLDAARLDDVDAGTLPGAAASDATTDVRVTLGDRVLVERGSPAGGTTVRRLVYVERLDPATVTPQFPRPGPVVLPAASSRATIRIDPGSPGTVRGVRVDGRVVLRDPDGLEGRFSVDLPRWRRASLSLNRSGPLRTGDVSVTYYPRRLDPAVLAVTVDA